MNWNNLFSDCTEHVWCYFYDISHRKPSKLPPILNSLGPRK